MLPSYVKTRYAYSSVRPNFHQTVQGFPYGVGHSGWQSPNLSSYIQVGNRIAGIYAALELLRVSSNRRSSDVYQVRV